MSKTKMIVALVAASAVAAGAYRWHSASSTDRGQRVVDRVWIDHMPRNETDKINVLIVLTEETAGAEVGLFQKSSMWAGEHELFTYQDKKGKLVATFPQTGETEELTATATRCDKGDMDFCLQIDGGSRGVKQYYSRKGWEIEGHGHSAAELERRIEQIEAGK